MPEATVNIFLFLNLHGGQAPRRRERKISNSRWSYYEKRTLKATKLFGNAAWEKMYTVELWQTPLQILSHSYTHR